MAQKVLTLFKKTLVEPCLEEEESYAIRSRKLAAIAIALAASNAIVLVVPLMVLIAIFNPLASNVFIGVALLYPSLTTGIIPYTYLRRTKKLPDWLVDLQMWSMTPAIVAFSLYVHHSATTVACSCIALLSIIMRIRLWPLMLILVVALNGLHSLILDYPTELPTLYDTFHTEHRLPIRILGLIGVNMAPLAIIGLGLYAVTKEFVERSDQADAAIAMNLAVAEKLRRYDTDGVSLILAANKGKVDENLLEAFSAIQHNLQEYRPHIPDYVIAATTDKAKVAVPSEREASAPLSIDEVVVLEPDTRLTTSDAGSTPTSEHSDTPNQQLGDVNSVPGANDSVRSTMSSMRREKDYGGDALTAHFYGRATTVFVRFGGPCLDTATDSAAERVAATLTVNNCVELASKHARIHGGAMQYMQGCGLMVSFNAASRVMPHERDACLFALGLRQDVDALWDATVQISIVTTAVLSFFAGRSGQLMLTVLGNFMPQHTAMHHHSRTLLGASASTESLVLISSSTMYGLGVNVISRPVGVVCVEGNKKNKISVQLFEVTGLVEQLPNAADDWMYAITRDDEDKTTELEAAMKLALANDLSTALDVIRTSTVRDSVVEYITKRLEACVASEGEFPVKVDTHRMW